MEDRLIRTELLLGSGNIKRLAEARVAVFGLGGVGSYVVEALARCGVGALDLVDSDIVAESNLNRQIIATVSTLGRPKAEVARDRVLDINPNCRIRIHKVFYLPETADGFDFGEYDYVVDAIDTVTGKLMLAEQAFAAGTPVISSMGTGNKLDPTAFKVADIYETRVCPLAKVMRRELRKRGIKSLKVVYSEEVPIGMEGGSEKLTDKVNEGPELHEKREEAGEESRRRQPPGSVSFVPSVAGLIIAGEVIKDLCGYTG